MIKGLTRARAISSVTGCARQTPHGKHLGCTKQVRGRHFVKPTQTNHKLRHGPGKDIKNTKDLEKQKLLFWAHRRGRLWLVSMREARNTQRTAPKVNTEDKTTKRPAKVDPLKQFE